MAEQAESEDGRSAIVLTAISGGRGGGLLLAFSRPRIVVDGDEWPGRWGRNAIPAEPGQHDVQVYVPYPLPRRRGPAQATVSVPANRVVQLEYCAPMWPFLPGSLGPPPQVHNGAGVTLLFVAAAVALVCLSLSLFARFA